MKARKFITSAALLLLALGVAVPAASAAPADVLGRYVATHREPADLIDRWLAANPATASPAQPMPVSDVENSLQVGRRALAGQPAPVSDLESSLQADRRAFAAQPSPLSDVQSSLQVAQRTAAATSVRSTVTESAFGWRDAGVGAFAALTLVALALSSVSLLRRHRHVAA
jgi:hypothetical protein